MKKKPPTSPARQRQNSKLIVWAEQPGSIRPGPPAHITPRAPTNISPNIPGIPLPPATDDIAERHFKLRRQESVIAEAHAARAGVGGRVQGIARNASVAVKDVIAGGFEVASYLGEGSLRAVRRFEAMPRRRQILWVATPYAVVIVLVLLLLHLRSPEKANAKMIAPQQAAAAAAVIEEPVRVPQPAPDPVSAPVRKAADAQPAPVVVAEKAVEKAAEPEAPAKISGTWQEVQALTFLRSLPNPKGAKVTKLAAKSKVIIYREMPSKEGWLVAQKPGAELGYVKATALEPREDRAEAEPAKNVTFKKRSKKSKLDPLAEVERPRRRR